MIIFLTKIDNNIIIFIFLKGFSKNKKSDNIDEKSVKRSESNKDLLKQLKLFWPLYRYVSIYHPDIKNLYFFTFSKDMFKF
jgi:hypothetical protein